jgi:GNAT superfamily N-acetyltransferase
MTVTVTYLAMSSADQLRPKWLQDPHLRILEATVPQWQFNRFLYCTVGADWSWTGRLGWTDDQWRTYLADPGLRTVGAFYDGSPAGYYELLRDGEGGVQIAYFGLLPAFIGRGFGGALLTHALEQAWAMAPNRVWVHTCTLDHPAALANYEARGMRAYRQSTKE